MMRILALVPGGIGDQILFFPTLAKLRDAYPKAQLDVVVEPRAVGAYQVCPSVNSVLGFNFKEQISLGDLGDLLGQIREGYYDAVISLGRSMWLAFFLWLSGIPKRVGYASASSFLLTDAVPLKPEQYAASMYFDLLQGFGIREPAPLPKLRVKKPELGWASQERDRLFGADRPNYVLLHPGASQLSIAKGLNKIYPVSNWVKIIKTFRDKRNDLPIALVAGPEDVELVQQFQTALPDLPVMRPPSIGALAAAIAGSTLVLCTDSAPMHLAVATQTPLVALFGPTDPAKLLPADGPFRFIQSKTGAIESISPEQVLEIVFPG